MGLSPKLSPAHGRDASERAARPLVVVGLALTALVYADTLRFEFVFDDNVQILHNPALGSWSSLPGFFTHHLWEFVASGGLGSFYRPIFMAWLLANYKLFGTDPAPWHATTVLVHLVATYLSYLLARRITATAWTAAVAAVLFGLHPVHIETAAWISGVGDSLYSAFVLGAFVCYLRRREMKTAAAYGWTAAGMLLFGMGLLSKEPAMLFPVLLVGYELLFPQRETGPGQRLRAAAVAVAPYMFVLLLYLVERVRVLEGFAHGMTAVPWSTKLLTWPSLLWFYVKHLVWPVGLSAFYETPYVFQARSWQFVAPLLLVLVMAAAAIWAWRRSRSAAVGFALLLVAAPLAPALRIETVQWGELAHDRYLYLPVLGFTMLVAMALEQIPAMGRQLFGRPAGGVAAALLLASAYAAGSATQNVHWANTLLLYARGAEIAPNNVHTLTPLADELFRRGRTEEALIVMRRMTELAPSDPDPTFLLGHRYYSLKQYTEAERYFIAS